MSELPPGWAVTTLGTVAPLFGGSTPKGVLTAQPGTVPFYKVADMNTSDGYLMAGARVTVTEEVAAALSLRICPAGSVIFPKVGGALHTNKKRVLTSPAAFDTNTMAAVPTPAIDERFLYYWLSNIKLSDYAYGSPVPQVSRSRLSDEQLLLPPAAEQGRIVAAIEEQFSRLDAGIIALERARQNLKRMRDLLPLLLLGRDRCATPEDSKFGSRHVDGSSYQWAQLAEVSEQVVDCPHSTPTFLSQGMPCIDTTCISPGVIHRDRLRYVDPVTYRDRVSRLTPQHGDLIFAREGTVGTTVVVPKDMHPCLGQRVMLFRPDPDTADSDYMCLVVNSEIVKRQYRSMLLGTTVPHLNVRDAKALRIPIPSLQVQHAIAAEADRIGSVLSAVETAVELNERLSSSLRSSILTAAFSGKLVPQDSDDEAASVLLEQIPTERASFNGRKPASSRKPRTPREKARI